MRLAKASSDGSGRVPLSVYFISGASAGAIQTVVSSPAELVKTRLQLDSQGSRSRRRFSGPWHCARMILQEEGVRGLSRGFLPTLCRDSPGFGFYFVSYEGCCRILPSLTWGSSTSNSTWVMLTAGGVGGIAAWLFSYPFDVVKSRLQADGLRCSEKFSGMLDCFRKSFREGGVALFTRGLGTTLVRAFPVNAVTFYSVDFFVHFPDPFSRKVSIYDL